MTAEKHITSAGKISCTIAVLQLPFHFLRSIKPKVSRIKVSGDQVILSVLAALEFLHTAFYQTLVLKSTVRGEGVVELEKTSGISWGRGCPPQGVCF